MAIQSGYCSRHQPQALQEPWLSHIERNARGALIAWGLALATPAAWLVFNAYGEINNRPGDTAPVWDTDDKIALLWSIVFSAIVLLVGITLNARQVKLSDALANAHLDERVRRMQFASLLSLKAADHCGLEVLQDALLVLPTFNLATRHQQVRYLDALTECFGSLALNVFPRNSEVPIVELDELRRTTKELANGLVALAEERANRAIRPQMKGVARLLEVGLGLDEWYRGAADDPPPLQVEDLRRLYSHELQSYCCWSDRIIQHEYKNPGGDVVGGDSPTSGKNQGIQAAKLDHPGMLSAMGVSVDVQRCSLKEAQNFLSPWYLERKGETADCSGKQSSAALSEGARERQGASPREGDHCIGSMGATAAAAAGQVEYFEVDYSGLQRGSSVITTDGRYPTYRRALSHAEVARLKSFREAGIGRMVRLLTEASNSRGSDVSVTIVVYEASSLTVVLDGNHRLAALLRAESIRAADRPVIVFRLKEVPARRNSDIIQPDKHVPAKTTDKCWFGFNPDVDLAKKAEEEAACIALGSP